MIRSAGGSPLPWTENERQTYTVVGVTADLVSTQMGNPRPQLFLSLAQHPASTVLVIARGTPSDPSMRGAFENAIADALRQPIRQGSARPIRTRVPRADHRRRADREQPVRIF